MVLKRRFWRSLVFLSLLLANLSFVWAQSRKEVEEAPASRVNLGQSLTLSEEVSRYGPSTYSYTNVYSMWDLGITLPKSELTFYFTLGGHISNSGATPGTSRFSLYKSLFSSFDFSIAHQINPRWTVTVSDSFLSYPNLDRFSGLRDFQVAVNRPSLVPSPFQNRRGAGNFNRNPNNADFSALANTFPNYGYGRSNPYLFGDPYFYGGGYGVGSFFNIFDVTVSHAIDARRQLDFTFDHYTISFRRSGFVSSSFMTSYTQQLTPKLSFLSSYSVGRYGFDAGEEEDVTAERAFESTNGRSQAMAGLIPRAPRSPGNRLDVPIDVPPLTPGTPGAALPKVSSSSGLIHTVLAGFSYSFSPDFTVTLEVGPSLSPSETGGRELQLAMTGNVSLSKSFRDQSQFTLEYFHYAGGRFNRLFTGGNGVGGFSLTYMRPITRRMDGGINITKFNNPFYGSGTIVMADINYRFTRLLTGTYTLAFFPSQRGLLGSGVTNGFTFDYPLGRDLSAFVAYYFTIYNGNDGAAFTDTPQPQRSSRIFGHSISVGVTHTLPSLLRIGRMR